MRLYPAYRVGKVIFETGYRCPVKNVISHETISFTLGYVFHLITFDHVLIGRREVVQIKKREPINNNAQNLSAYCLANGACLLGERCKAAE